MEIAEKSNSRVDSAVDVLSGKLKDILAQKEKRGDSGRQWLHCSLGSQKNARQ